jgi:phenylalanyl-tRNA synthetase beta chain
MRGSEFNRETSEMKISLEWLAEYLPGALDAQKAADALTHGGLPVEQIEKVGPDTVIDVEVTSNRSDCLSHLGVARELAAFLNREFKDVPAKNIESTVKDTGLSALGIDAPDLCPHYTARVIRNVKIGPSPTWMRRRLEAVGLRPINNVVDVTNYVLFEMGQPLHAFDFDTLHSKQINVRRAKAGEKLVSIDGHERVLSTDMLVIADADRAVALAGVMGGRDSEVLAGTVNVLLESARFDPLSIRGTARTLAMASDSSYRFERGIDPTLPERASLRATQLILQTAGGEVTGPLVAAGSSGYSPKALWLRLARLQQVLGVQFPSQAVVEALTRLRLSPVLQGERIDVTVPSYRLDLNLEIDLVEEVARVIGYDKVPVKDQIQIRLTPPNLLLKAMETIRSTLVAGGFFEAVTFSFVTDALAGAFAGPEVASLPKTDARVRKADGQLRPSMLPGLLEAVRRNETNGTPGAKLFEIGSTFWNNTAGTVQEQRRLGLVGGADYRSVRGVIECLLDALDGDRAVKIVPMDRAGFAAGACGRIEWGSEQIGYLGKVDRSIADQLSLRELPVAAELELSPLLAGAQHVPQLHPLPRFPAVRRDLSLVVAESIRFEQLAGLIGDLKIADLETTEYVTTYRGKPLDAGQKSVTVTLVFRSATGTLISETVESSVQRVIDSAKAKLGATLRV